MLDGAGLLALPADQVEAAAALRVVAVCHDREVLHARAVAQKFTLLRFDADRQIAARRRELLVEVAVVGNVVDLGPLARRIGFFIGPIVGAIFVTVLSLVLSDLTQVWQLYFGLFFIAVVAFAPGGITGLLMMHRPLIRAGMLQRMLLSYLVAALPTLALCVGLMLMIETIVHYTVNPHESPNIKAFGIPFNAESPMIWSVAAVLIVAGFVIGIYACERTGRALGVPDHGAMVWDEIIAIWLVLLMVRPTSFAAELPPGHERIHYGLLQPMAFCLQPIGAALPHVTAQHHRHQDGGACHGAEAPRHIAHGTRRGMGLAVGRLAPGHQRLDGVHDGRRRDAEVLHEFVGLATSRDLANGEPPHGHAGAADGIGHGVADAPQALARLLAEIREAGRPAHLLYTIPTFQNPTGHCWPEADRAALAAHCDRTGTTLFDPTIYFLSQMPSKIGRASCRERV